MRATSLVQLSGRNSRKPTMTGTSPEASVSDTSVWQLAFLPSTEAYSGATPIKWRPFLGKGRIVNDQPSVVPADHPVGFGKQRSLQRGFVPDAAGNKMMQPS